VKYAKQKFEKEFNFISRALLLDEEEGENRNEMNDNVIDVTNKKLNYVKLG
jgi:hypothetical protein